MKRFLSILITMIVFAGCAMADDVQEVRAFFNNYVNAANTYDNSVTTMYSPNAKIIRQVVKPDGGLANAYTDTATYVKQMKIGQAGAKLRGYTNSYSNVKITNLGNGVYKIDALRQPKGETYKLKIYQKVKKINGKWTIIEELMQTKEQIFLRYAK